jgi:hypothetical protein
MNNELERVIALSRYYCGIYLEGLRETHSNTSVRMADVP